MNRVVQPFRRYLDAMEDLLVSVHGNVETLIQGAGCDSRTSRPGWLFVAVRGEREDGVRYLPEARARGTVALVTETHPPELPASFPVATVSNAYTAAARIAELSYGFPARTMHVTAVTGTNGKTTCACLLDSIFTASGHSSGLISTVGYKTDGEPLPCGHTTPPPFVLQRLLAEMVDAGVENAVIEASSHALTQDRLGSMQPEAALFTHLTPEHLDYHGTMDRYFAAKSRLFTERLAGGGVAAVGTDGVYGRRLATRLRRERPDIRVITYGARPGADVQVMIARSAIEGLRLRFRSGLTAAPDQLTSPLIGEFNALNIAGAVALTIGLGIATSAVTQSVAGFSGAPGRMQVIRFPGGPLALVDYAHTDDALAKALRSVRNLNPRRVVVVFGCGGDRDRSKRPRMGRVAAELADQTILTNDNPRTEPPEAILSQIRDGMPSSASCVIEPDRRKAIHRAISDADPDDVILVAGKGHETDQNIGADRIPFDDVEEVRTAFKARVGR